MEQVNTKLYYSPMVRLLLNFECIDRAIIFCNTRNVTSGSIGYAEISSADLCMEVFSGVFSNVYYCITKMCFFVIDKKQLVEME